jgi:hypothetical protein
VRKILLANGFVQALDDVADARRIDIGCVLSVGSFNIPHGEPSGNVVVRLGDTALVTS